MFLEGRIRFFLKGRIRVKSGRICKPADYLWRIWWRRPAAWSAQPPVLQGSGSGTVWITLNKNILFHIKLWKNIIINKLRNPYPAFSCQSDPSQLHPNSTPLYIEKKNYSTSKTNLIRSESVPGQVVTNPAWRHGFYIRWLFISR